MANDGITPRKVSGGSVAVVIPARFASTRLPGKPLLEVASKPLIQHVFERASLARTPSRVVIATDDDRILAAARSFGAEAFMTSSDHASGTDRIAELVSSSLVDASIIVNVQGDEPEIEPAHVDAVARLLLDDPRADIATLATPVGSLEEYQNPNAVKAVLAASGFALYFSRATVPFIRDGAGQGTDFASLGVYRHVGLYAYRRESLLALASAAPSRLEKLEKLEQLRALELGLAFKAAIVDAAAAGIDTPDDLKAFADRLQRKANERE